MEQKQILSVYLGAFVDELTKQGVSDVIISPGSRSTPLALLMAENEKINTYLHVDERSAAFFALGMAKAKKKAVAILCTSGTAAANYYPAIIEAYHSRIPLLVLTADRPHELRDVGAPQAMNQLHLFGDFVKVFIETALPEGTERMCHYIRSTAARGVSTSLTVPAGPVHINFPLREPLVPDLTVTDLWDHGILKREQHVDVTRGQKRLSEAQIVDYVSLFTTYRKGLIVCGQQSDERLAEAMVLLSEKTGYPILADPLSGARSGGHKGDHIVECYDTFLRSEAVVESLQPDIIIRFGDSPVSKAFSLYVQKHANALQLIVDEGAQWRDPSLIGAEMVYCNEALFCHDVAEALPTCTDCKWLSTWTELNALTKEQFATIHTYEDLFEGKAIPILQKTLPEGATLFVGNSMPIRDMDTFFEVDQKGITIMANRGVNGIDGTISSALGAGTDGSPLVLFLGDLSFYHDLNGLLMAKLYKLNATIVVMNNDGGGIFSYLPQYAEKKHFEVLFGTPLGLDYEHTVRMYDGHFARVETWNEFESELQRGIHEDGLHVIEMKTDREKNLHMHRTLWNNINDMLTKHITSRERS
ncbi:2-succinyl-5-enolpyruvyl-6-hydroxy-3-cyclohexene-1-carboxylic-acid synthase [Priestia taiwanensis]|uniref:2-succinyl-5-enolpyruvyl-6-hydroxy-3-cyclohexene-1-carboxylate synthase n=1 Tax=Priestia taiwanensis TaxID=1347902 RepID=A0A917ER30_9BACI|nr:2-succinyl-5-enolpyruvyl-6-hydroxy-3-cyclohexene-1-carboxylic-acid synthase [Priestia taiwanensis]MBM7363324.1 2-succinyl-5-enolpyruvyl-6-hydroxy-3-cyclohexene-1-carboxylate synthase [Priestia taiwanensis]GGE78099.1 2-succinyl-5-enolpyruvyl-6-hydroxy-3-cyclohexene-1-carboxylate synthase [Priestia taiwanensis]